MSTLSRAQIENAFTQLGHLALKEHTTIELLVMGGAAMVLGYQARESTHDIDALIVKPQTARLVREWAAIVARSLELEEDWLNDGAKGFLHGVDVGPIVFQSPGITVWQVSSAQLLAMKLSAWRDDVDINDASRLLDSLVQTGMNRMSVWEVAEPYLVPGSELKAQYAFADLWEKLYDAAE